jgi:hypothetical protein
VLKQVVVDRQIARIEIVDSRGVIAAVTRSGRWLFPQEIGVFSATSNANLPKT